jgi:hypothetical protein
MLRLACPRIHPISALLKGIGDMKQYHKWMTDSELLELTASEPLTLEEEMEMQSMGVLLLPNLPD